MDVDSPSYSPRHILEAPFGSGSIPMHVDSEEKACPSSGVDNKTTVVAGRTFSRTVAQTATTDYEREQIKQAVFEKLRNTFVYFPPEERKIFEGYSLNEICSNPALFQQLLLIADEIELVRLMQNLLPPEAQTSPRTEQLRMLAHTTSFGLHSAQLTSLPKLLGDLFFLTDLRLECDLLTELPPNIGTLLSLETLFLSYNRIRALPPSFPKLRSLCTLRLEGNLLQELPDLFGELQSLSSLHLEGNLLRSLPPTFHFLYALTSLHLEDNRLETLSETFGFLVSLKELYLDGNRLTQLPTSFRNFTFLHTLSLSMNRIASLPASLELLFSLTDLNVRGNQLHTLPVSLGTIISLTSLDLRNNPLPVNIELCRIPARLYANGCKIHCEEAMQEGIKRALTEMGRSHLLVDVFTLST